MTRCQEFIGLPTRDELSAAIQRPAEHLGVKIDPQLVEQLVDDIVDVPDALPLLQEALYLLWKNRRGQALTLQTYKEFGGAKQVLGASADQLFASLTGAQQKTARSILLRLVDVKKENVPVRRPMRLVDFPASRTNTEVAEVIQRLIDGRLVVVSQSAGGRDDASYLEMAHEGLVSSWPRMRMWLDEERDLLRLRQELTADANRWVSERARLESSLQRQAAGSTPAWRRYNGSVPYAGRERVL